MTQKSVGFDPAVEFYDQTRGFPRGVEHDAVRLFVTAGNLTAQSRVLEVGVGTGRIALPLAPHVGSITGLDLSLGMMGKLLEKRRGERVNVVQGDATHLPFPAASFDAVTATHFFHLVPTWHEVLVELKRVLVPGGLLLHGWNVSDSDLSLDEVWRSAAGIGRGAEVGVPFKDRQTFLPDNGWTPVGEEQVHKFITPRSPQDHIDALRNRTWSRTWSLSDEELNAGVAVVEAYIREHYPDPTAPIPLQSSFHVQAYRAN